MRGATTAFILFIMSKAHFNPRTPCGVRPAHLFFAALQRRFQSTHPMRGATTFLYNPQNAQKISIHAPHAGCDCLHFRFCFAENNFNPRTPCGVRLSFFYPFSMPPIYFNPRTPCGVRHPNWHIEAEKANFNPRTPCGVRLCDCIYHKGFGNFNPRTPCGVRPYSAQIQMYSI